MKILISIYFIIRYKMSKPVEREEIISENDNQSI